MIALAKDGYSEQEVRSALSFRHGTREIDFRYDVLNRDDVKIDEICVTKGRVGLSSLASIKRTAGFEIAKPDLHQLDYLNDRIRPVMVVKMPDGGVIEYSLGVFLISSPTRKTNGRGTTRTVEAYDKSLIVQQDRFTKNYVINKGRNCVNAVREMLESAGLTRIDISDSDAITRVNIEYDTGESKLTAINDFLSRINYTSLTISEDGRATANPYRTPDERMIDHFYVDDDMSILLPEAEEELDIFDTPNIFIRITSNPETEEVLSYTYVNDNPRSALSTVSRGRSIVDYEELIDIYDADALQEYVTRVAIEKSQAYSKVKFKTALIPNHTALDMLYLRHGKLSAEGRFTETSWSMELTNGGQMSHEARRFVTI